MELVEIAGWFSRMLFLALFVALSRLFKSEPAKRRIENEKTNHYNSKYQRLLRLSSIIVITFCIGESLLVLFQMIPNICIYTFGVTGFSWSMTKLSLTFYQIQRLQYCFSSQQIHSAEYGYSCWSFVVLYIVGIINVLSTIFISFIIVKPQSIDKYGCVEQETSDKDGKYIMIGIAIYVIWDWSVLFMYIYKVLQIYFKTDFEEQIYQRIYFVLKKIVFLTILYEIFTTAPLADTLLIKSEKIGLFTHPIAFTIDIFASAVTIYLMMEHNNDDYLKLTRCISRKSAKSIFVENVTNIKNEQHDIEPKTTTTTTSTEIHRIECVDMSEITVTN